MEKKEDLLLDIDCVVCFPGFLKAINDFLGTDYVIDDFTDYYIDEVAIPKERFSEFNKFISERNIYEDAQILPHAIETIKNLNEFYNIYPCSSCVNPFDTMKSGRLFADKYNFLIALIPFVKPEQFIFTSAKHLFKASVQIDDLLSNFDDNIETKILFPSYHNKDIPDQILVEKGVIRAGYDWRDGWLKVEEILLRQNKNENDNNIQYSSKNDREG